MYSKRFNRSVKNVFVTGTTERGKCTRARYYRKGKSTRLLLSTYSYERRKSGMVHPSVAINNGYKGVPEDSGNNRNQNDKTNY